MNFGESHRVSLEAEHLLPISWMCKKETSISHSFTESDIILLDAGKRMGGLPALDFWDVVFDVLRSTNNDCKARWTSPKKLVRDRRPSHSIKPRPKHQLKEAGEMLSNCRMWTTSPQTHPLLKVSLNCTF